MPLRTLACGPWSFLFSTDDGALRHLRFGGVEVLRGVYAAVRDANWDTIEPRLSGLEIRETPDACAIAFAVDCTRDDIRFAWRGAIRLEASGTLSYRFAGQALSHFRRNRIGFCVLHAPDCAGLPCEVTHVDGSRRAASFPAAISPHQPLLDLRALAHEPAPGLRVQVRMDGDTFEMEDQRNWTDASFKTYCTPLGLPFPVAIADGTTIEQSITVRVTTSAAFRPAASGSTPSTGAQLADAPQLPWPPLGFGATAPHLPRLGADELISLQALRPAHLRVEIPPGEMDPAPRLDRALSEARWLNSHLEVALRLDTRHATTLDAVAGWAARSAPAAPDLLARWIVTTAARELDPAALLRAARARLAPLTPAASFVGGTDAYFAELNRRRPPLDACDAVSFSINPQVHAFDDLSLIETLPMQGVAVRNARAFCDEHPVLVSPITLRPRYNPNATGPAIALPPTDALPPSADPRQASVFAALWTLGSIKHLAQAGAASLTYYQTTGHEGLLEADTGKRFPVWTVFHAIAEFAPTHLVPVSDPDPLRQTALLLAQGPHRRLLVARFDADSADAPPPLPADATRRLLLGARDAAHLDQYDFTASAPASR